MRVEPAAHAVGRSRGGPSTKIHQLCDGQGLPLVMLVGPGQGGDSPMLVHLLAALKIHRVDTQSGPGPGRPRNRPTALLGDKAYSSRATRTLLRARGITAVIPEPADQTGHRKRRGQAGGRPPALDTIAYKGHL